jgi:hypothetical protein
MHHGEAVGTQEEVLGLRESDPVRRREVELGQGDVFEGEVKIVLLGLPAVYACRHEHIPI